MKKKREEETHSVDLLQEDSLGKIEAESLGQFRSIEEENADLSEVEPEPVPKEPSPEPVYEESPLTKTVVLW